MMSNAVYKFGEALQAPLLWGAGQLTRTTEAPDGIIANIKRVAQRSLQMLAGAFAVEFGSIIYGIGALVKWLSKPREVEEENSSNNLVLDTKPASITNTEINSSPDSIDDEFGTPPIFDNESALSNNKPVLPPEWKVDESGILLNENEVEKRLPEEYLGYPDMFDEAAPASPHSVSAPVVPDQKTITFIKKLAVVAMFNHAKKENTDSAEKIKKILLKI